MVGPIGSSLINLISTGVVTAPPAPNPFAKPAAPKKPGPKKPAPKPEKNPEPKTAPKSEPKPVPDSSTQKLPPSTKPPLVGVALEPADAYAAKAFRKVAAVVQGREGTDLGRDVYGDAIKAIAANLDKLGDLNPPKDIAARLNDPSKLTSFEDKSFLAKAFAGYANGSQNTYADALTKFLPKLASTAPADVAAAPANKTALINILKARWLPTWAPDQHKPEAKTEITRLEALDAAALAKEGPKILAADKTFYIPLDLTRIAPLLMKSRPAYKQLALVLAFMNTLERYATHTIAAAIEKDPDLAPEKRNVDALMAKILDEIQAKDPAGNEIKPEHRVRIDQLLAQSEEKLVELGTKLTTTKINSDIVKDAVECKKPGGVCVDGMLRLSGGYSSPIGNEAAGGISSNVAVARLTAYPASIKYFLGLEAVVVHGSGAARLDSRGKSPIPFEKRGQVLQPVQAVLFGGGVVGPVTITGRLGIYDVDCRGKIADEQTSGNKTFGAKTGGGGFCTDTLLGGALSFGGEHADPAENVDSITWNLDVAFGDSGSDFSIYSQLEDPETGEPTGHFESKDQTAVYVSPSVSFKFFKDRLRLDLLGAVHKTFPSKGEGVTTGAWGVQLGGAVLGDFENPWAGGLWYFVGAARGYYDNTGKMNHVFNVSTRFVPVDALGIDFRAGVHTGEQPTTMGSAAGSGVTPTTEGQTTFGGVPSVLVRPAVLSSYEGSVGIDWKFSNHFPSWKAAGVAAILGIRYAYLHHKFVPEAVTGRDLKATEIDEHAVVVTGTITF